jgi:hypothetical protein
MLGFILLSCSDYRFLEVQLQCLAKCAPSAVVIVNTRLENVPAVDGITVLKNRTFVSVTPHVSGFHKAWFTCYSQLREYDISHVVLMASNEMYFRPGVQKYVEDHIVSSYQHSGENIQGTSSPYYTNALRSSLFRALDMDWVTTGQWEGSFYPKSFFENMYNKCAKLSEHLDVGQSAEEVIIPSLTSKEYKSLMKPINTHLTKVFYDRNITEAPVEALELPVYSIKRVCYDVNSPLVKEILRRLAIQVQP